ncbi:MAG: hypothetical protein V3V61_02915 [Gammaproteobacteria bacterium]
MNKPPIEKAVYFGLGVMGLFLLFFGGWATFAPLESAAIATGVVAVESKHKTVQHLEGGIIADIHIEDGSVVKKHDPLITLDNTPAQASLARLRHASAELYALEARLQAEREQGSEIVFPEILLERADNSIVKKLLASQEKIFVANKKSIAAQESILKQRILQSEEEINSLQAQVTSNIEQLELIAEETEAVAYLESRKLIERPRLLALQRETARLEGDKGHFAGLILKHPLVFVLNLSKIIFIIRN